jgi:hypothetical protein
MSLKQSIVVVNEFSVPTPGGGKHGGSRGGTPGAYVMRYMARKGATEPVTPIRRRDTEDFILRYMARESATEKAVSRHQLKDNVLHVSGQGGVAFGYGQPSLSDEGVRRASADIQRLFDEGHTVMKTVLSFSPDYLQEMGVVPKGFVAQNKGDYRGHIDQMRLRMAVMHGLGRMGHRFDDLRYVGVIQVDTLHVHCHLAMVDAGLGRRVRTEKGFQQKGKLTSTDISLLRRGVDSWLDENQHVAHMSSAVGYERLNVAAFVKRWAHEKVLDESLPQLLLACLPADKTLWRYGSHRPEMRRANSVATELVTELLDRPGSPMGSAMIAVETYANRRAQREGLGDRERQALVRRGYETIMERSVNGLYQVLQSLPPEALSVRTPMLTVMSQDVETLMATQSQRMKTQAQGMSADDDLVGFSLRLRSYGSRLREHDTQREQWRMRAADWEAGLQAGAVSPQSEVMHRLYLEEEEYHARCVSKYRSLLGPLAVGVDGQHRDDDSWKDVLESVDKRREAVVGLEALLADRSIPKMKDADEAEKLGVAAHGVSGGRLLAAGGKAGRTTLKQRLERARASLSSRTADLVSMLSGKGLVLQAIQDDARDDNEDSQDDRGAMSVVPGERWALSQTKGMDLHDVRSDTVVDMALGRHVANRFVTWARRRQRLVDDAQTYLHESGQEGIIEMVLPLDDVRRMNRVADELERQMSAKKTGDLILTSALSDVVPVAKRVRRSATVGFDEGLAGIVRDSTWNETERLVPQLEQVLEESEMQSTDSMELG